jgi:flagellar motor switch/type III secretory pathway protein FliN
MAEDDRVAAPPASLPVHDLELTVAIELDRLPVTLGELQKWAPGQLLTLRQGPQDPVRLVVETGLQRRVLAEGRVVVVNGKLGIEVLRLLTRLEDVAKPA